MLSFALMIFGLVAMWLLWGLRAAPSGAFVAGKNSRISVNGTNLTMADWTGTFKGDMLDVTNFESLGYHEWILGCQAFDWSVSGTWNANQNPQGNPPKLYPTDSGTNMILYTNQNAAANYTLPQYCCSQGQAHPTATGLVAFSAQGTSQGTFTVA
jgi:hypothetical protein